VLHMTNHPSPPPHQPLRYGSMCSGAGMLDAGAAAILGMSPAWHAETRPRRQHGARRPLARRAQPRRHPRRGLVDRAARRRAHRRVPMPTAVRGRPPPRPRR
jgi:hypothetical protein